MVFKSGGRLPNMETWTLSPGSPETRRDFFLSASASADVLFNGAFVVQDSEATKASAAPPIPGVRRSPTWCQYPTLRQSGGCAPALVEKDRRKHPWGPMIAGRGSAFLNSWVGGASVGSVQAQPQSE